MYTGYIIMEIGERNNYYTVHVHECSMSLYMYTH